MAQTMNNNLGKKQAEEIVVDGVRYLIYADGSAVVGKQISDELDSFVSIADSVRDSVGQLHNVKKILRRAFSSCKKLEVIEIADSVEEIEEGAFLGCGNLKIIKLPERLKVITNSMLYSCSQLQTIVIPDSVTRIETNAFFGCRELSELILPEALTYIGENAFGVCSKLKKLNIPAAVETIKSCAFDSCNAKLKVDPANLYYRNDGSRLVDIRKEAARKKVSKDVSKDGNDYESFSKEKPIRAMTEKDGFVYYLGLDNTCAIAERSKPPAPLPKRLVLPAQLVADDGETYRLTEVCSAVFIKSLEIEEVVVPEGVEMIGNVAFTMCNNITKVSLPSTLKSLGESVFSNCEKLTEVNWNGNTALKTIGKDTFFSCVSLKQIELPQAVEQLGGRVFGCCKALEKITLPSSLTNLGNETFSLCKELKSIIIPPLVDDVNGNIFYGCSALESIVVDGANGKLYSQDNCVIERGTQRLLAGCKNSVVPIGIKEIAENAFRGRSPKYMDLPYGVVKIGDNAFANNLVMLEISIPETVTEICDGAFEECIAIHLRCRGKTIPEKWSKHMGVKPERIELNSQVAIPQLPVDNAPKPKKRRGLFALFGRKK